MPTEFIVNRGLDSILKNTTRVPIKEGALSISEDGQNLYLDSRDGTRRIHITDVIDITGKTLNKYYPNKIYIDGTSIKRFNEQSNQLDKIAELDNEVKESEYEFTYNDDRSKATIETNGVLKKGTIIIDKTGNIGVVISSTPTIATVAIITDNRDKDVLSNYDIYFDSNYIGNQVGTFTCPFSNASDLFKSCKELIENDTLVVIHIKANSVLEKSSDTSYSINNVVFMGNDSSIFDFSSFKNDVFTNVTITNLTINKLVEFTNSINLTLHHCLFKSNVIISNCENITLKNCEMQQSLVVNTCTNTSLFNCKVWQALTSTNDVANISIYNCEIHDMTYVSQDSTISIYDSEIHDVLNLTANEVNLYSGLFISTNDKANVRINADNINLGLFNFNGFESIINGTVNSNSGLMSIQVHDETERDYFNNASEHDNTLKSHLDAINYALNDINDRLTSNDSETEDGESNNVDDDTSFKTKDTFKNQSDLNGNFRIGDVMTYINNEPQELIYYHNSKCETIEDEIEDDYDITKIKGQVETLSDLEKINLPSNGDVYQVLRDGDSESSSMYVFNGTGWNKVPSYKYIYYTFSLENAGYYVKPYSYVNLIPISKLINDETIKGQETINLKENEDGEPIEQYIVGKVSSVSDNEFIVKVKIDDLMNQINTILSELTDGVFIQIKSEEDDERYSYIVKNYFMALTNINYNQDIKVSSKDRLIRLSNGWDKLSGSTDGAGGYYHIVPTYSALGSIDNDNTREIGTLAYVQDEEVVYQWKYIDDSKRGKAWLEFSSGSGGQRRAKLTLISKSDKYGLAIDDSVNLSVEIFNCTTGTLKVSYTVNNKTPRNKTFNIVEPGLLNIILDDFAEDVQGVVATNLRCSITFTSTDSDIGNPDTSINEIFYLGSTVSASFSSLVGINASDDYIIKESLVSDELQIPAYVMNDQFNPNDCWFRFNTTSISNESYKVACSLYKNNELLCNFNSSDLNGTQTVNINFPTTDNNNNTITYNPGIYKIVYAAKTAESGSSEREYTFILENSIAPTLLILNKSISNLDSDKDKIANLLLTEDTTNITIDVIYLSIFNNANYTLNLETNLISSENNRIDKLVTNNVVINEKKYQSLSLNVSDPLISDIRNKEAYQSCSIYINGFYNDLSIVSNSKLIEFDIADSILIVKDRLVYNLNSLGKSNNLSDKYEWKSSIVSNDNLNVMLNSFDYNKYGWVKKIIDDSGEQTVLYSDGYESSALLNLSPLYKYDYDIISNDVETYDVNKGYTFQIKFKAEKTNDNGTILECIDELGRGFLIKEDKVFFSPYEAIPVSMYNNSQVLSSGLTTGIWHEISFVVDVDSNDNNKSPYEEWMYDNDMYENSGNIGCKSCAFLFIDGILSGMCRGEDGDGVNKEADWYSTSELNDRLVSLFAQYDYSDGTFYNYGYGEIMHIRQYNKALTPEEILTNYIADMHDSDIQTNYCNKNGLEKITDSVNGTTYYQFGVNSNKAIPTLHFYNADLKQIDSIMGTDSKEYVFPNVTVSLSYKDKTLFRHYGCEVKVQGTSSTNYAIKNYRLRFYNDLPTDEQKSSYAESLKKTVDSLTDDDLNNYKLPDSQIFSTNDQASAYDYSEYNTLWHENDFKRLEYRDATSGIKYGKKLPISINGWLPESRYTLKADYMDSSHTHNTGTARLANEYMPKIPPQSKDINSENIPESPYNITDESKFETVSMPINDISDTTTIEEIHTGYKVNPIDKVRQAIDGFPVLITYSCEDMTKPIEKGIYMFDIDKNADYIFGYNKYQNKCKSYEVSNNTTTGVSAGAGFDADLLNMQESYEKISDNPLMAIKNDIEIRYHYNEELNEDTMDSLITLLAESYGDDNVRLVDETDYSSGIRLDNSNTTLEDLDNFLSIHGFKREIGRYENINGDVIDYIYEKLFIITEDESNKYYIFKFNGEALNSEDEKLRLGLNDPKYVNNSYDTDTHQHDELKHLYMWLQDCKKYNLLSDEEKLTTNLPSFKDTYSKHFDINNINHYIILVKCLAMIDNLAKNMMITTWNADEEYIVYTVDNNNKISINYDKSTFCKWYLQFYDLDTSFGLTNDGHKNYDTSIDIKGHNKITDIDIVDGIITKNDITDIVEETYNASNSNLWNLILGVSDNVNYSSGGADTSLQYAYSNIRSRANNNLSTSTFKDLIINSISDKIGEYYFNLDAKNKYFGWNFIKPKEQDIKNPFNSKAYFYMCNGSAKEQMTTWLEKRLIYLDTYYAYDKFNTDIRPYNNVDSGNLFIKTIAPLYFTIQYADDSLIIPDLCTSETNNVINCKITSDANMTCHYLKYVTELSNLGILQAKELKLSGATNLVKLNLSDCTDLINLNLSSGYLKKLNVSSLKLTSLNVSSLNNLVELDISKSKITKLDTGNISLRKLNVTDAPLNSLDFSNLNQLESLGKINLSTNTNWNTYDKFISQLNKFYIINDENKQSYLTRMLNQFKNTFEEKRVINDFNNDILAANLITTEDIIRFIFTTNKYRNELGEQFIPNLAIVNLTSGGYKDVKINSSKLKAVYLNTNDVNNSIGNVEGSIHISGDNIEYIYINNSNLSSSKSTINITCKNLKYLTFTNNKYANYLDLSSCESLETLNLSYSPNLKGVFISDVVRGTENVGTLKSINLSNDYSFQFLGTLTEFKDSNTVDSEYIIDLSQFELNKLILTNVLSFKAIKNMHLILNSSDNFDMYVPAPQHESGYTAKFYDLCNLGYDAYFINSHIYIENEMYLDRKFSGRSNLIFSNNNDRGLTLHGLSKIKSFHRTFEACFKVNINDVYHFLGVQKDTNYVTNYKVISTNDTYNEVINAPINCTDFKRMFNNDIGIEFPQYNGTSKRIVPGALFTNCKSATTIAGIFGNYGRKSKLPTTTVYDSVKYSGTDTYKDNSLILDKGIFDIIKNNGKYITSLDIRGAFSDNMFFYESGNSYSFHKKLPTASSVKTEIQYNDIYGYNSYVYAVYDNIFEKLTGNTDIGNGSSNDGQNCMANIFGSSSNNTNKVIIRSNSNDATVNTDNVFHKLIKNFSSFNYDRLFLQTAIIRYATSLSNAINSNFTSINVNNTIFKNANNNNRTITSLVGTFAFFNPNMNLTYEYINNDAQYPELTRQFNLFDNINTSYDNPINLATCFYNNSKITTFDTHMFLTINYNDDSKLYEATIKTWVSNMAYMFAYDTANSALKGFLYKGYSTINEDNEMYYVKDLSLEQFNIFTGQTKLQFIDGLFSNRTGFGGLKELVDNVIKTSSDLPINMFEHLESCKSMSHLFDNCTSMNFDFSNLCYTDDNSGKSVSIYLFKNCKNLINISYMFNNCKGLVGKLPSYNNKGSQYNDVEYFYYDITNSVINWIYNKITDKKTIVELALAKAFIYRDGFSPYKVDANGNALMQNGDYVLDENELIERKYDLKQLVSTSIFKNAFKCSNLYETIVDNEPQYTIYQYYKGYENCSNIEEKCIIDGVEVNGFKYMAKGLESIELNTINIHNKYINIPGFFYIESNMVNNDNKSPLQYITGVFNNCSNENFRFGIPSNIFKDMTHVINADYVFNNCSYIGLDDGDYRYASSFAVSNNNAEETIVEPPFIIPYRILDDLVSVTSIQNMFKGIRYLSKPFRKRQYYVSDIIIDSKYVDIGLPYNEIYVIPKYFLYFNTSLINTSYLFYNESDYNYLTGMINPDTFINNKSITNISYMFASTGVVGDKEHSSFKYAGTPKLYIGLELLRPLINLNNANGLFYNCRSQRLTLIDAGDDFTKRHLLFDSNYHKINISTANLISIDNSWGVYSDLFQSPINAKLVKNSNSNSFDYDKQCYQYFTTVGVNNSLQKYEG